MAESHTLPEGGLLIVTLPDQAREIEKEAKHG